MDDVRVSTIECGAIKQFHHYKIHTRKCIPRADRISNKKNALNSVKIKQQRKTNNKFVFFVCANLLRFHEHTNEWICARILNGRQNENACVRINNYFNEIILTVYYYRVDVFVLMLDDQFCSMLGKMPERERFIVGIMRVYHH